jgi:CubicO group peptidase (beta-lactamase class C family)
VNTHIDSGTLTQLLDELRQEFGVPGAQLAVRRQGQTITAESGEEALGRGRQVTRDSAFPVGSLTKPFTATLAMMLVSDEDVELDAPLVDYVPELSADVTLRQILSHTGGLVAGVEETASGMSRRRWVEKCSQAAVAHPPGTVFAYSNVGYLLAGHLVEEITGMGWRQAVESFVLRPLGVSPVSVVEPPRSLTRSLVDGHAIRPGAPALPIREQTVSELEEPVAGMALSAADLIKFVELHLGHTLLDPQAAQLMRTDQLAGLAVGAFGLADGWGLGWSVYRNAERTWFGHDGTGDGAWSHLRFEPESGTAVALTTNAGNGVSLWEALVERLRKLGVDVANHQLSTLRNPGSPIPRSPEYAGYFTDGAWTCAVEARDGELYLSVDSEPGVPLTLFEDLSFTTAGAEQGSMPYIGRFIRSQDSGEVDLLQITGRLARRQEEHPAA